MISQYARIITAAELSNYEQHERENLVTSGLLDRRVFLLMCVSSLVIVAILSVFAILVTNTILRSIIGAICGLGLIVLSFALFQIVMSFRHPKPQFGNSVDNRDTNVNVTRVKAFQVLSIIGDEDSDRILLFDVGDQRCYLVSEAYYWTLSPAMAWPSDEFEVLDKSETGDPFGIVSIGLKLEPEIELGIDLVPDSVKAITSKGLVSLPFDLFVNLGKSKEN